MNLSTINAIDPIERFRGLCSALGADHQWLADRSWLRFAAQVAVLRLANPTDTAQLIRETSQVLRERSGWHDSLQSPFGNMVAACLVQIGDTPEAFLSDLVSARRMLHEAGMPHSNWYELKAVLALRLLTEGVDATPPTIRRLHDIYIRMRSHHWWKTGRDDLPACAILSACPGDPSAIADRAESVYRELARCGVSEGQSLQAAANILPVSGIEPTTIAHRYLNVSLAITECGIPHQQVTFATRAMLSLLDQEPTKIVARFVELYQKIGSGDPFQTEIDLAIAADLCFIDLIRYDHDHRAYTAESEVDAVRLRIGQQRAISVALAVVPATPMVVYGPMYPWM